jgi:O-antigen/teichoic acid export membrane protein
VPGAVNFAAIVVFTRLLSTDEYGTYALVVAWAALGNAIGFSWLRAVVRRFASVDRGERVALLSTVRSLFAAVSLLGLAVTLALLAARPRPAGGLLLLAGYFLLISWAWFELNLAVALADKRPGRYGIAMMGRSIAGLTLASGLALLGLGAVGLLVGVGVGFGLGGAWLGYRHFGGLPTWKMDPVMASRSARYGLPLTASFALGFLVSTSDRILLDWFLGKGAVGAYSAAYDLVHQAMTALMMTVNLGAFQLAVDALEEGGLSRARPQLERHGSLLLALGLPAAVGCCLLAENIARVLLGTGFSGPAARLIPIVAIAALLAGLKSFYFDLAFQLGKSTTKQIFPVTLSAVVNVAANLWLIPRLGLMGAAWATLVAVIVGLLYSVALGRGVLPLPVPWPEWLRVGLACAAMVVALLPLQEWQGATALGVQVSLGVGVYGVSTLALDVAGARRGLVRLMR